VKSAHASDGFVTGAQIEMVSVAEDDFRAERFERVLGNGFDGSLCADRHEDRCLDCLMRKTKEPTAAAGGGFGQKLVDRGHQAILSGIRSWDGEHRTKGIRN
jgi:hypothetical protein